MEVNLNDIVGRASYSCDIPFRVINIYSKNGKKFALLYGEDIRLIADAPIDDLVPLNLNERRELLAPYQELEEQSLRLFRQDLEWTRTRLTNESSIGLEEQTRIFQLPGKVLHIDGDPNYLKKCITAYNKLGVPVIGIYCNEKEMPFKVPEWVEEYNPDILVITGHDSYSKLKGDESDISAYRHSKDFVQTVKNVRKNSPNLDHLIIFAGACQSHFESLIYAGANFASSPSRVNIHALDPVYIVSKLSYSHFDEPVQVWNILRNTISGEKGIGGIETKGALRMGMPYIPKKTE